MGHDRHLLPTRARCAALAPRIIVEESIHDAFVKRFAERANAMTIGNPLDNPDMGPLVSEGQLRDVLGYVQKGIEEGATLVCGGERYTEGECAKGYLMRPTIFDNCTPDMTIVREEIFGPVVTIQTFKPRRRPLPGQRHHLPTWPSGVFTHQLERPSGWSRRSGRASPGSTPSTPPSTRLPGAGTRCPASAASWASTAWRSTRRSSR